MAHLACGSCIHIPTYCPCRDTFIHEWMVKRFTNNLVGGFCFQIIPTILYSQFGSLWQIMRVEHNPCSRQPTRSTFTHTHMEGINQAHQHIPTLPCINPSIYKWYACSMWPYAKNPKWHQVTLLALATGITIMTNGRDPATYQRILLVG